MKAFFPLASSLNPEPSLLCHLEDLTSPVFSVVFQILQDYSPHSKNDSPLKASSISNFRHRRHSSDYSLRLTSKLIHPYRSGKMASKLAQLVPRQTSMCPQKQEQELETIDRIRRKLGDYIDKFMR